MKSGLKGGGGVVSLREARVWGDIDEKLQEGRLKFFRNLVGGWR